MIRKTSETRALAGNITSAYNDSQTSTYSTEYTNAMNTYSTDETFTGKYWIDGKPIYRKVFTGTTGSTTGSWQTVSLGIANLKEFTDGKVKFKIGSSEIYFVSNYISSSFNLTYRFSESGNAFLYLQNGYTNMQYVVIVEYTKTTD